MNVQYSKVVMLLGVMLFFLACNTRPKPNKIIKVTVQLEDKSSTDEDIDKLMETIKKRMYKVCLLQKIHRVGTSNQIYVEAATHFDANRITRLLSHTGTLDFYQTHQSKDVLKFILRVNELSKKENKLENPLLDLFTREGYSGGGILFYAAKKDTAKINTLLSLKAANQALQIERKFVKFLWGIEAKDRNDLPLYAVKLNPQLQPEITSEVITKSNQEFDQLGRPVITIQMNEQGATIWEELTDKAYRERSQIAMVIDNIVYSAPGVSSGPIIGGKSQISGDFTVEEAQDLSTILTAGSIPNVRLKDVRIEEIED